jgi:DNA invertase Pin-like site-specific DNA recombinase
MPTAHEKITPRQRERRAYVYIRQSTPKQVRKNRAGQENQYALVARAQTLGWSADRIQVIDDDLGQSGQDGERLGFQELVSAVSLGHVGLILAYEASRLARSNAAWYTLLDLATLRGTLLADVDSVYDPRDYHDRLVLGLQGMLSEAELHLLHLRLAAGRQRQITQGTYQQHLPTGLTRLDDGQISKDPDQQIQHTLTLVFERFGQLGSCQKVLRSLRDDGVLLPRRQVAGPQAGELLWKRPSSAMLYGILHNPAYAGAFAYGRKTAHPERRPGQRGRAVRQPLEAWTALHHDRYPAYISWAQYLANQQRLADNASSFAQRARGAPRDGAALLAGLVVCGRCGHQMRVSYKRQPGYVCNALSETYRAPMCLRLAGAPIEAAVVAAFFAALAPAELAVLDETLAAQQADRQQLMQYYADQVARTAYEVRRAERRYAACDPDNRLVAAELERQWELALRAQTEAQEATERFARTPAAPALAPALRVQLHNLGTQLPALWRSGRLSAAQQKELLRSLIRRVMLTRPTPGRVEVKIVWVSGAVSLMTTQPALHRGQDLPGYPQLLDRLRTLSAEGHTDQEIACQLTAEGFRSARRQELSAKGVETLRRDQHLVSLREQWRRAETMAGQWTVGGLARAAGVSADWLRRRIGAGTVPAVRHPGTGRYLIPAAPDLVAGLKAARDAVSTARRAFC